MNPEKCCFCDKPFVKPYFGCNPYPILRSDEECADFTLRCCNWCDSVLVNTARMLPRIVSNPKQRIAVMDFIVAMCKSHREAEQMKKEMMERTI